MAIDIHWIRDNDSLGQFCAEWQQLPVAPRGATLLGISFRPLQAAAFGLDPRALLPELLTYPFN